MSSKAEAIVVALIITALIHDATASGTQNAPTLPGKLPKPASTQKPEATLPPIPEFCQTGRPEAAVDCACLLLIKDKVQILFTPIFLDVCERFIGREAIIKFGPRGCRRFRIKLDRRLRFFKILKLVWFVNKLLPVCVPIKVPRLVLVGIRYW